MPKKKSEEVEIEVLGTTTMRPRLTACIHGRTKHGKTWLALTAPGDLGIISMDGNCKTICEKYHKTVNADKTIHYAEFLRTPLSQVTEVNELKEHWRKIREAYYKMLSMSSIRTVIVDTHTQMWEDCKLAYVGREKPDATSDTDDKGNPTGKKFGTQKTLPRDLGEAKREIREMINAAEDKNLVLLCTARDLWRGEIKVPDTIERQGMPGIEYLSQCEIETSRDPITGTFIARIMSSTANSNVRGRLGKREFVGAQDVWVSSEDELVDEEINFGMVGTRIFPWTEFEDWS